MRPRDTSPAQRVWRLGALMAIATVAAVVAIRSFPPPPTPACPTYGAVDSTYAARLDPDPRSGVHDYDMSFLHRGDPEDGFQFCLRAAMDGMPEMQVRAQPDILGPPGRLRINFEMAGSWDGQVLLISHHRPAVAVLIHLVVG